MISKIPYLWKTSFSQILSKNFKLLISMWKDIENIAFCKNNDDRDWEMSFC